MKVLSGLLDPNDRPKVASVFHSLDPLERTSVQIKQLRAMAEIAGPFVAQTRNPVEGADVHPDVYKKAADTVVMILHQIDTLVNDQPRWAASGGESEEAAKKMLEAEHQRAVAETERNREAVRPFFFLKAKLFRTPGGAFLAINDTESVHAHGATAEEAVRNFDQAFFELRHLPVTMPPPPPPEPEPKPVSKRRNPRKKP